VQWIDADGKKKRLRAGIIVCGMKMGSLLFSARGLGDERKTRPQPKVAIRAAEYINRRLLAQIFLVIFFLSYSCLTRQFVQIPKCIQL
jgi:hypothetical protein